MPVKRNPIRRVVSAALLAALLCAAAPSLAATWVESPQFETQLNELEHLEMYTEYAAYQPGESIIYLRIKNGSVRTLQFGPAFYLERLQGKRWQRCVPAGGEMLFPADGYTIKSGKSLGIALNIGQWAGDLTEGRYRIVKSVGYADSSGEQRWLSAEFLVMEGGYTSRVFQGYQPLAKLPAAYSARDAEKDGVFFYEDGQPRNKDMMLSFLRKVADEMPAMVRVMETDKSGGITLSDVTFIPQTRAFKVATDASRAKGGTGGTRYFAYAQYGTRKGAPAIVLNNCLIADYPEAPLFVLAQDIRQLGKAQVEAFCKQFYKGDGTFRVFAANGADQAAYMPRTGNTYAHIHWDSKRYGSGRIPLEELGKASELVNMEWVDETHVRVSFVSKKKVRTERVIDIQRGTFK